MRVMLPEDVLGYVLQLTADLIDDREGRVAMCRFVLMTAWGVCRRWRNALGVVRVPSVWLGMPSNMSLRLLYSHTSAQMKQQALTSVLSRLMRSSVKLPGLRKIGPCELEYSCRSDREWLVAHASAVARSLLPRASQVEDITIATNTLNQAHNHLHLLHNEARPSSLRLHLQSECPQVCADPVTPPPGTLSHLRHLQVSTREPWQITSAVRYILRRPPMTLEWIDIEHMCSMALDMISERLTGLRALWVSKTELSYNALGYTAGTMVVEGMIKVAETNPMLVDLRLGMDHFETSGYIDEDEQYGHQDLCRLVVGVMSNVRLQRLMLGDAWYIYGSAVQQMVQTPSAKTLTHLSILNCHLHSGDLRLLGDHCTELNRVYLEWPEGMWNDPDTPCTLCTWFIDGYCADKLERTTVILPNARTRRSYRGLMSDHGMDLTRFKVYRTPRISHVWHVDSAFRY